MKRAAALITLGLVVSAAWADGPRKLKPGFNLFSKQQDIELGQQAARQVEQQVTVVRDPEISRYVERIGAKLAATPEAGGFPYSFQVVSDKSVNAFALPGGPAFVYTGLLTAADNEAQVAGVLAHEISHVALRHGTNQVSKANLVQLPAILAGGIAGGSGSLLGNLAQLGVGVGAGSILLKFSRNAERDADLLGTRIMARAGYNPIEMARFFEKLEAEGGPRGPQFLSDHPNPGNRVKAVEAEIRYLPRQDYTTGNQREFDAIKKRVASLPPPPKRPGKEAGGGAAGAPPVPQVRPSGTFREYRSGSFRISYPDNWHASAPAAGGGVSIAPPEGIVAGATGTSIGIGVMAGFSAGGNGLRADTDALVERLRVANAGLKLRDSRETRIAGLPAVNLNLESGSPFAGTTEVDQLLTVERPEGLFYLLLIAPQPALAGLQPVFERMAGSLQFGP